MWSQHKQASNTRTSKLPHKDPTHRLRLRRLRSRDPGPGALSLSPWQGHVPLTPPNTLNPHMLCLISSQSEALGCLRTGGHSRIAAISATFWTAWDRCAVQRDPTIARQAPPFTLTNRLPLPSPPPRLFLLSPPARWE